jgi:hypothetical protein
MEIYGLILAGVLCLCWISDETTTQRLGLWMLASWAASNAAIEWMGFDNAPLLVPLINGFIAVMVAMLGYRKRNFAVLMVFLLFLTEGTVNWLAYADHMQGSYAYYAILNCIFLLRMGVVGGSACVHLAGRISSGDRHSYHSHPGGA